MELYTIQMGHWRKARELNVQLLDVTVKTGDHRFAPTWDLLARYKAGIVDAVQYTEEFKAILRTRYNTDFDRWLEVAQAESVAFACYCKGGEFCHRLLLVEMMRGFCKQQNIPFEYKGELK